MTAMLAVLCFLIGTLCTVPIWYRIGYKDGFKASEALHQPPVDWHG